MITEQEQQKIMEMVLLNPFDRLMNYEVVTMEPGHLVMKTIAQREIVENSYQSTHGGFLFGLADTYMGAACFAHGKSVTTMGLRISYIRPVVLDSTVTGTAEVIHNGRNTMRTVCDFRDERGRLLAHCEGTFYVLGTALWMMEETND